MSNEENTEQKFTYVCSESGNALSIHGCGEITLAPVGKEIWRGSPQELAALVRDARRYRKLEQAHDCTSAQVRGIGIPDAQWCERYRDMYIASSGALAEIADALPEVEQK